ncbi:hypothetical protein Lal_00039483 [Lupinus albus]|nr:hypothetical protein Lal_00039483 [Lupinus albus]
MRMIKCLERGQNQHKNRRYDMRIFSYYYKTTLRVNVDLLLVHNGLGYAHWACLRITDTTHAFSLMHELDKPFIRSKSYKMMKVLIEMKTT